MLGYMTKEQIYNMRMEAADNLESRGIECATCRSSRIEGIDAASETNIRRYSTLFTDCTCLYSRPRIYSEISYLYSKIGLIFLPIYFKKKAAQAANDINFPILALSYINLISEKLPRYWLISNEDKAEEEAYFNPLVLDVSLKKTIAESFLHLGNVYHAVLFACKSMEMLGIDSVCFYGAYKPQEFKRILSKFDLLYAEYLTKLVGTLAKAHVLACEYNIARNLLQIEYLALKSFPIDFLQVLSHMTTMYRFKYLIHETETLNDLEENIIKLCKDRLCNFEKLMDLTEIVAIANSYAVIIEISFALAKFEKAQNLACEAIRILELNNYKGILSLIRILLTQLYFHIKNYEDCSKNVFDLLNTPTITSSRKYRSLSICCLSMFLTESLVGIHRTEINFYYDMCNTFASTWRNESCRLLPKDFSFYISAVMTNWCFYRSQYSDENILKSFGGWINAGPVFIDCYKLSLTYQKMINKSQYNYWIISGLVLLLKIQIKFAKEKNEDISVDKENIQKELDYLKDKVKTHYTLFHEKYKILVTEAETLKL